MYAIIDTNGKQVRVAAGDTIEVAHVDAPVGAELTFDRVLLVGAEETRVGAPFIEGARVRAVVLGHELDDKVTTLKYRRRKRSRVKRGFRASITKLQVLDIAV